MGDGVNKLIYAGAALSLAFWGAVGVGIYAFVEHENKVLTAPHTQVIVQQSPDGAAATRNPDYIRIADESGVPPGKESLVLDVIFNQHGDCSLLGADLQTPCATAKEKLGVTYQQPAVNPK
jgi:hypothetical protein